MQSWPWVLYKYFYPLKRAFIEMIQKVLFKELLSTVNIYRGFVQTKTITTVIYQTFCKYYQTLASVYLSWNFPAYSSLCFFRGDTDYNKITAGRCIKLPRIVNHFNLGKGSVIGFQQCRPQVQAKDEWTQM